MLQRLGVAVGAGIAAALLVVVLTKGTPAALLLACLAPLPLFIAALGWGLGIGALAGGVAALTCAALLDPLAAGLFAASIALPAWILSAAASLPRARLFARGGRGGPSWLPVGGIVAVAALIGALVGLGLLAWLVAEHGGYGAGAEAIAADLAPGFLEQSGGPSLPAGYTAEDVAKLFVQFFPAILAATVCMLFCANLYAGARAVQLSHRLTRPWPNLPESLVLPQFAGLALFACAALALLLRGPPADVARIGVGALGSAFAMQGLAVVHVLSRGLAVRLPALIALYLACFVTTLLAVAALAVVGVVESLLSLRARRARAGKANPETKA